MKLSIIDITKSYGANKALYGFTAASVPGINALPGPKGIGKSTQMNIIKDDSKQHFFIKSTGSRETSSTEITIKNKR